MLHNYSIGTRLGIGFGSILMAAVASFAAIVFIGLEGERKTEGAMEDMHERVSAVNNMIVAQLNAAVSVRNAAMLSNSRSVKTELETYNKALKVLQNEESAMVKRGLGAKSKSLLDTAIAMRRQSEPIVEEAMDFVMTLAGEEGARVLQTKLAPVQNKWADQLKQLAVAEQRSGEENLAAIKQAKLMKIGALAGVLLCVIGGVVVFAVLLTRSVTKPLKNAAGVANRVAQGELNVEIQIEGKDEAAMMLRSLQAMAYQLAGMVKSVRQATESISSASEEISRGNLDLSNRTEHQAASLQQTSASLSELTTAVSLNTEHADSARALAERTALSAQEGGTAMAHVITTMSRISESSNRIADIIGVIDGIAFQTNILALNAAVEAARAGEQGRGFAVVASEVRALAHRVTTAASEVRTLITESVERVEDGSRQVSGMGATMNQLVDCSQQVKGLVDEIAHASSLQRQSIGSVSVALREVDGTTQQNAALVEQVSAAAQSLVRETHSLDEMVGRFRIDNASHLHQEVDLAPG